MNEDSPDNQRLTHLLLNTPDAMTWAEQFCLQFDGRTVCVIESEQNVDPGLMVGWFANAMQTAINFYERRRLGAKEEIENIFKENNGEPT